MGTEKILVAYASKRGSAQQAAEWIAEELGDQTDLINLYDQPSPSLEPYEVIVLGSGMEAGSVYPPLKKFIKKNEEKLAAKKVCLFITHFAEGEGIEEDFRTAFSEDFLAKALVRAGMGGRLELKKVSFLARPIMKMIAKQQRVDITNYDNLSQQSCIDFARAVRAVCFD